MNRRQVLSDDELNLSLGPPDPVPATPATPAPPAAPLADPARTP